MIARRLETWFRRAKRPMPWRAKAEPYACWISEIMMQQTTYAQALPYYTRFLAAFPTVEALAAADEASVLKAWEGLGYYARARNLHAAAKEIAARGTWPRTAAEWARVKGVGPYTAAALASVLSGERVPVVDGNVARVFARYWLLDGDFHKLPARKRLAERLQSEMDAAKSPGDFNQSMMELGALVCTPRDPDCGNCPLKRDCRAFAAGTMAEYPRKAPRKELPLRSARALIVRDGDGRVLLVRNREGGLLKGLWELPTLEDAGTYEQTFSHFKLALELVRTTRTDVAFVDPREVPLTTAARKILGIRKQTKGMENGNE